MTKLEYSKALGRKIRQDPLPELGVSTYRKIKEAIQAGRTQEALELVDYLPVEGARIHEMMCDMVYYLFDHIAKKYGEEELYKVMREMGEAHYKSLSKLTPLEFTQLRTESQRAHHCGPGGLGDCKVTEDKDKYIITFDPCGSGGSMRRKGRLAPPFNFGKTKKAYPWSWGKTGVPYFCLHCAIWSELLPIEWSGYPQRVTLFNEDPNAPCTWVIYKKPEDIPEEYFTRLGKKKDVSKMKKP